LKIQHHQTRLNVNHTCPCFNHVIYQWVSVDLESSMFMGRSISTLPILDGIQIPSLCSYWCTVPSSFTDAYL